MGLIGLGMQIAILLKLKKVESQPTNAPWVISYDTRDGVMIARIPSLTSHCETWRHSRNLVSPIGSCVSFIVCQIWVLAVSYYYMFNLSPSGPPIVLDFLLFMIPSRDFFLLNLIETMCSPTLRNSLFELIKFGPIWESVQRVCGRKTTKPTEYETILVQWPEGGIYNASAVLLFTFENCKYIQSIQKVIQNVMDSTLWQWLFTPAFKQI